MFHQKKSKIRRLNVLRKIIITINLYLLILTSTRVSQYLSLFPRYRRMLFQAVDKENKWFTLFLSKTRGYMYLDTKSKTEKKKRRKTEKKKIGKKRQHETQINSNKEFFLGFFFFFKVQADVVPGRG
jgi:hypothetical protein